MSDLSLSDVIDLPVPRTRTKIGDRDRAVALAIRERRRIARRMQALSAQLQLSARPTTDRRTGQPRSGR